MELERDVPRRMGEVPPDHGARGVAGRGQTGDVVCLSGREVHAGEEHEGELVRVLDDGAFDIARPQRRLTGSWPDDDEVADGIESARREMARERMPVGREQRSIDQDPPPLPAGRKNDVRSRWMLTVSVLRNATSVGRAPTIRPSARGASRRR